MFKKNEKCQVTRKYGTLSPINNTRETWGSKVRQKVLGII